MGKDNSSWDDILEICKPIFQHLNINYFGYGKAYKDGTMFDMSSNPNWVEHFIQENYIGIGFDGKPFSSGFYTFHSSLNDLMPIEQFVTAANSFDMHHPFVIVNKFDDYYEYFHLATQNENTRAYDFYFNNIDIIQKALSYFKNRANDLIQEKEKNRYRLPEKFINSFSFSDQPIEEIANIDKEYLFDINANKANLSKRQYICTQLYVNGRTSKYTAQQLGISYRTVEYYISIVKEKLGCRTREDLRKALFETSI